jgi:hypothetical protein
LEFWGFREVLITRRASRERCLWQKKRPKKLGRHLALHKQGAEQSLSANPDRRFKSGSRNQLKTLTFFEK